MTLGQIGRAGALAGAVLWGRNTQGQELPVQELPVQELPVQELPVRAAPGDSVYTEEAVRALLLGTPELGVELHGFLNVEYYAIAHDPDHPDNSFDIHNVFLSAKTRVGPDVALFVELEYEHGSTLKVDRAFIDFEVGPALVLRAGRFSSPYSYERIHYAAPVRLMTSRPLSVDVGFHEWVDTGLMAFGRIGRLGYDLAVLNGPRGLTEAGIPNVDVVSSHQNKTVLVRLNAYPTPELEGGVAGAAGAYDPESHRWFYLAELDARLRRGRLDVWAELDYRTGDDEPCSALTDPGCEPTYVGDHARKWGGYALVGYAVVQDAPRVHYLKPVLRYDELDDLRSHTGRRRVTAGIDWSPRPHLVLKSEGQWAWPVGASGVPAGAGLMLSAVADY